MDWTPLAFVAGNTPFRWFESLYCVSTATLVSPRTALVLSVNVTKMRLLAGLSATAALADTKMPKVGVALELIVVVTVAEGVCRHWPVCGLVWHKVMVTGRLAAPVLVATVIVSPEPRLSVATANSPLLGVPVTCTMPSFCMVAARTTTSGVGVVDADSSSVLSPVTTGAGAALLQLKLTATLVGANAALGVSATTKLCDPLWPAMLTGVLAVPVRALVVGLVV